MWGCRSQENHITLVDVPSGQVAGLATEQGILLLNTPSIKSGDIYSIRHIYGNSRLEDEAIVIHTDEYLAIMAPISVKLNMASFLRFPIKTEEELYIGVLDEDNDPVYLPAELFEKGAKGDFVLCKELHLYPEPIPDKGYGGLGLFAYRQDYLWLAGILTPMKAQISGVADDVYTFVGMDTILRFLPNNIEDLINRVKKPFRPDLEFGINRDGSGE